MNLSQDDVKRIAKEAAQEVATQLRQEWRDELKVYRMFVQRVLKDFYGEQLDGDATSREGMFDVVKRNDERVKWLLAIMVVVLVIAIILLVRAF